MEQGGTDWRRGRNRRGVLGQHALAKHAVKSVSQLVGRGGLEPSDLTLIKRAL